MSTAMFIFNKVPVRDSYKDTRDQAVQLKAPISITRACFLLEVAAFMVTFAVFFYFAYGTTTTETTITYEPLGGDYECQVLSPLSTSVALSSASSEVVMYSSARYTYDTCIEKLGTSGLDVCSDDHRHDYVLTATGAYAYDGNCYDLILASNYRFCDVGDLPTDFSYTEDQFPTQIDFGKRFSNSFVFVNDSYNFTEVMTPFTSDDILSEVFSDGKYSVYMVAKPASNSGGQQFLYKLDARTGGCLPLLPLTYTTFYGFAFGDNDYLYGYTMESASGKIHEINTRSGAEVVFTLDCSDYMSSTTSEESGTYRYISYGDDGYLYVMCSGDTYTITNAGPGLTYTDYTYTFLKVDPSTYDFTEVNVDLHSLNITQRDGSLTDQPIQTVSQILVRSNVAYAYCGGGAANIVAIDLSPSPTEQPTVFSSPTMQPSNEPSFGFSMSQGLIGISATTFNLNLDANALLFKMTVAAVLKYISTSDIDIVSITDGTVSSHSHRRRNRNSRSRSGDVLLESKLLTAGCVVDYTVSFTRSDVPFTNASVAYGNLTSTLTDALDSGQFTETLQSYAEGTEAAGSWTSVTSSDVIISSLEVVSVPSLMPTNTRSPSSTGTAGQGPQPTAGGSSGGSGSGSGSGGGEQPTQQGGGSSAAPSRRPTPAGTAPPSPYSVPPTPSQPTVLPSVSPSIVPSLVPTNMPVTVAPTVSFEPTQISVTPTEEPSMLPTSPTEAPSLLPSEVPSSTAPSVVPTVRSTASPTPGGSSSPSSGPSSMPISPPPTLTPSTLPSVSPNAVSYMPTSTIPPSPGNSPAPSAGPSAMPINPPPSVAPSTLPSPSPTYPQSFMPTSTISPSLAGSPAPSTASPSIQPSRTPTLIPTLQPTIRPTVASTTVPTVPPTIESSIAPTVEPSMIPTRLPTTLIPTTSPTTVVPSAVPTTPTPTEFLSHFPTQLPSLSHQPSEIPSESPSVLPTFTPTIVPSLNPTLQPTRDPTTAAPSMQPTTEPTTVVSTQSPSVAPAPNPSPLMPSQAPSTLSPSLVPTLPQTTAVPSIVPSRSPTNPKPTVAPTASDTGGVTSAPYTMTNGPTPAGSPMPTNGARRRLTSLAPTTILGALDSTMHLIPGSNNNIYAQTDSGAYSFYYINTTSRTLIRGEQFRSTYYSATQIHFAFSYSVCNENNTDTTGLDITLTTSFKTVCGEKNGYFYQLNKAFYIPDSCTGAVNALSSDSVDDLLSCPAVAAMRTNFSDYYCPESFDTVCSTSYTDNPPFSCSRQVRSSYLALVANSFSNASLVGSVLIIVIHFMLKRVYPNGVLYSHGTRNKADGSEPDPSSVKLRSSTKGGVGSSIKQRLGFGDSPIHPGDPVHEAHLELHEIFQDDQPHDDGNDHSSHEHEEMPEEVEAVIAGGEKYKQQEERNNNQDGVSGFEVDDVIVEEAAVGREGILAQIHPE